jgi:hypothetical protein
MGFKDEADLDAAIKTTEAAIKRARNKELGIEEEEKVLNTLRSRCQLIHNASYLLLLTSPQ